MLQERLRACWSSYFGEWRCSLEARVFDIVGSRLTGGAFFGEFRDLSRDFNNSQQFLKTKSRAAGSPQVLQMHIAYVALVRPRAASLLLMLVGLGEVDVHM